MPSVFEVWSVHEAAEIVTRAAEAGERVSVDRPGGDVVLSTRRLDQVLLGIERVQRFLELRESGLHHRVGSSPLDKAALFQRRRPELPDRRLAGYAREHHITFPLLRDMANGVADRSIDLLNRVIPRNEFVSLFGEIERSLEPRNQIQKRLTDRRRSAAESSLEIRQR